MLSYWTSESDRDAAARMAEEESEQARFLREREEDENDAMIEEEAQLRAFYKQERQAYLRERWAMADEERAMRPARTMGFTMPKSMFRPDADRLRDMRSNMHNQSRATNMNALFGLLWTPVAKGWK